MKRKKIVIVGGGTSGLNIANNLQSHFNIVVTEKSKYLKCPNIFKIPLLIGILFKASNEKYIKRKIIKLADGRKIPFFSSNMLGGSSVMNGCVHTLGSRSAWKSIFKKFEFGYEDLIAAHDLLYTFLPKVKNKIKLTYAYQNIIDEAFFETLSANGIKKSDTLHSEKEGCGPVINTVNGILRASVLSLINRRKFVVMMDESVTGILFNSEFEVTGVKTDKRVIECDFVILAAGVIGTCEILLNTNEILKIANSENVNQNLDIQDHANLRINVLTNIPIYSLNEITNSLFKKILVFFEHILGKKTLMLGTGATSSVHLDLDGDGIVDTRINIVQFFERGRHGSEGEGLENRPGFSLSISPINPKSIGKISINERGETVIDPAYISSPEDLNLFKLALEYSIRLLKAYPLNKYVLEILDETTIVKKPEEYISTNIFSGHHLIGGTYNLLNENFNVKNFSGLYICDGSVIKEFPASNIHSSVLLLSQIFSDKFMQQNS